MNVLVIEDSDVDFMLIERALGEGFSLRHASTMQAGISIASEACFDLIILDLSLPDSCGYQSFERARDALPHIPIVILSGSDDEELSVRAVSNGAQDFVRKSCLIDHPLDRTARYAVERHGAERRRLEALQRYRILDTNAEKPYEDLVLLAAHICQMPIAMVSLVDAERQWFKAKVGINADSAPRSISFCNHAIRERGVFIVQDASTDPRFSTNPMVIGAPNIRFYAGAPLITKSGEALGTICVIDRSPRTLRHDQTEALQALSRQVVDQFELRSAAATNARLYRKLKRTSKIRITEAKLVAAIAKEQAGLREAVAGMEQVLGVVGHELRTPLAAVRAISEFLTTDGALHAPEADGFLRSINQEVIRMSDTVNNLLEAARLNSGRAKWNWEDVDLNDVIADAVQSIKPLVNSSQLAIQTHGQDQSDLIRGDAEALRRLVLNLLSNAVKHTASGQIAVSTKFVTSDLETWAEVVIADTGSGIPPELVSRLGEAFALNSGVVGANHVSGTGLGLAICKGIAAAHGGKIAFSSVQGVGTTVTVRIRADLTAAATGDTEYSNEPEEVQ